MKKLALTLAFASSLCAGAAQAQVMIDMQRKADSRHAGAIAA
jgi:hypothetical protein